MFSSRVESWRGIVDSLDSGFPTDFILAWIQIESDGEFPHKSKANERGPMEISPGEREYVDLNNDGWDRLMEDAEFSIKKGIDLASYYRYKYIPTFLTASWSDWDLLKITKATHAGGVGFIKNLYKAATGFNGRQPSGWNELAETVTKIFVNDGEYTDSNGARQTLPSRTLELGPRVLKQIEKLERFVYGNEAPPTGPTESLPMISSKLLSPKIAGIGIIVIGLTYFLMSRKG